MLRHKTNRTKNDFNTERHIHTHTYPHPREAVLVPKTNILYMVEKEKKLSKKSIIIFIKVIFVGLFQGKGEIKL